MRNPKFINSRTLLKGTDTARLGMWLKETMVLLSLWGIVHFAVVEQSRAAGITSQ